MLPAGPEDTHPAAKIDLGGLFSDGDSADFDTHAEAISERGSTVTCTTPTATRSNCGSRSGWSTPGSRFERVVVESDGAADGAATPSRPPRVVDLRTSFSYTPPAAAKGTPPLPQDVQRRPNPRPGASHAPMSPRQRCSSAPRSGVSVGVATPTSAVVQAMSPLTLREDGQPPDRPKDGGVQVYARLRPGPRSETCVFSEGSNCIRLRPCAPGRGEVSGAGAENYWCDHAFGPESTQLEVYECAVAPICEAVLGGYNGAVIAYGQTGSGKTHTVVGDGGAHNKGIIPRAVAEVFDRLKGRKHWSVKVSVLEIYNERTRDLLAPGLGVTHVDIHETVSSHGAQSFHCPDATERKATNPEEALTCLFEGLRRRETARTDMNHHSSRSHLIFTLTVTQSDDALSARLTGRLHLVDLAGCERLKRSMSSGGAAAAVNISDVGSTTPRQQRDQRREAGAINKSLTQLALVIHRLTTPGGGLKHIPYRDSMLTRLLADSFGGSSKTCLIITCSSLVKDREETRCALEFGRRANLVKNVAEINIELQEEPSGVVKALIARELADLRNEREELRHILSDAASEALAQQRRRAEDVRQLQEENEALQRKVLEAAAAAAEFQEDAAAETAKLQQENRRLQGWLRETSSELVRAREEKAALHLRLVEMAAEVAKLAGGASSPQLEEALAAAQGCSEDSAASFLERSAERCAAMRRSQEVAVAKATAQAKLRQRRLAALEAEARELHERWGDRVLPEEAPGAEGTAFGSLSPTEQAAAMSDDRSATEEVSTPASEACLGSPAGTSVTGGGRARFQRYA